MVKKHRSVTGGRGGGTMWGALGLLSTRKLPAQKAAEKEEEVDEASPTDTHMYAHVRTYTPMYTHMPPHVHLCTHIYPMYTHVHTYTPMYTHIDPCTHMYTHTHPCTHMYTHTHTCTHIHTHVRTGTHIHTHVHTYTPCIPQSPNLPIVYTMYSCTVVVYYYARV